MSVSCADGIEMSWMRHSSWDPSSASFPFCYGMGHESVHDCHDTADSRVFGMAETEQECCYQHLGHGRSTSVLATS